MTQAWCPDLSGAQKHLRPLKAPVMSPTLSQAPLALRFNSAPFTVCQLSWWAAVCSEPGHQAAR